MKYLADTHTILWARQEPERLSRKARRVFYDGAETVYCSIVSLWEIAIKSSLRKLRLDGTIEEFAHANIADAIPVLALRVPHLSRAASLAWHHRDPFDRMLIAQAQTEDLTIITADKAFAKYSTRILW